MSNSTKQRMAEEFHKLMCVKNVDQIIIKDISDACGMSRQSFYYHFQDILDLVEWIAARWVDDAVDKSLQAEDPVQGMEAFVKMANENAAMIRKFLNSQYHEQFQRIFFDGIKLYLTKLIRSRHPDKDVSLWENDQAITFYAGGIAALLLNLNPCKTQDHNAIAGLILQLITRAHTEA